MNTLKDISQALKKHRKLAGLEQSDMKLRIGMSQQQYQRMEAGADVRLSSLLRVLEGLNLKLMLVPKNRMKEVESLLATPTQPSDTLNSKETSQDSWAPLIDQLADD